MVLVVALVVSIADSIVVLIVVQRWFDALETHVEGDHLMTGLNDPRLISAMTHPTDQIQWDGYL